MIFLGSHVSMKAPNYLLGSIQEALSYDANACMIYTGPPQNSKRVPIEKFKVEEAKRLMEEHDFSMDRVIIHAPYIINLANSMRPETAEFGVEFLQEELRRVDAIGASVLVLHPGAHVKAGVEVGVEWIVNGLNQVLDQDDSNVVIALETMAGKGSEIGSNFEELAKIREQIHKKERIKICLDTCHIHDAGYDLTAFDAILDEFDSILGLENLAVLHINDSKNERGARKDRHENIGNGFIGFETLAKIVHHPKLESITKILETPYIENKPPYNEEIEQLLAWKDQQ
ncbi:deoxyribonuclease IV [Dubosiella newyorkensis]|jgi:deoxyribonuclease-4|uniref:deoxyribonuclease IV n=2 Tax=Dubosiella newyorkensis TaxID=1862672 RepID=UPI00235677EF|nr:deoxyribonuclease IV [Dubosiella newyorkensis]MCI9040838.1 deoxyribonuclease IV [Dubosiella newyorkensis]